MLLTLAWLAAALGPSAPVPVALAGHPPPIAGPRPLVPAPALGALPVLAPLLGSPANLPPTEYAWAKTWGGASASTMAKGIVVDGSGNIYVVGEFYGAVDFDPAGANPSATVASDKSTVDAFLTKFNSTGAFQWVRTWGGAPAGTPQNGPGGPDGRDAANGVMVDGAGNIYVAGLYQNTADFGAGFVYTSNAPSGSNNIFVAKFAPNGVTQWARTWGGTTGGEGYSVAVDQARGLVYVEGDWSSDSHVHGGQVDFNPAGPTHDWHVNHGFYDAFLSQYDLNGYFQWARTWGGGGYDDGPGVAVDSVGHVYVAGMYGSADINFDPAGGSGGLGHGTNITSYLYVNIFLSQFDSSGNFQWVRTWGGPNDEDAGEVVAVDAAHNAYIGGRFSCTCNFNAGPAGAPDILASHGDRDAFISKYDSSGNFLWARTWGGSGWDSVGDLAVDGADHVFTTGFYTGTVDFNPTGGGNIHVSQGDRDVFVNQYDSAGNFQWVKTWGGAGADLGLGLAVDGAEHVFVDGSFQNTVNFNPDGGADNHTALGVTDAYYSVLRPSLELTGTAGDQTINLGWTVNVTVPLTATWIISYTGGPGSPASPITGLALPTRTYTLTGVTNGTLYTLTLNAMVSGAAVLTDTAEVKPARFYNVYLPLMRK